METTPNPAGEQASQEFLHDNMSRLHAVPLEHLQSELAEITVDPEVGIKIAKNIESPHQINGVDYMVNGAEIAAGKKVKMHVHHLQHPSEQAADVETYVVREGNGIMRTGTVKDGVVVMNPDRPVAVGDEIIIPAETTHELSADPEVTLRFTFSCPDTHLDDRNREFVDQLPRETK